MVLQITEQKNGNYYNRVYVGVYRVKGMETAIIGSRLGFYMVNGKENGNRYSIIGYIFGLYGDNGKENGRTCISGLIMLA